MSSLAESIFELSLSEKLQLMEDLWDDIASTPEDVPVRDWQKEELAQATQSPEQSWLSAERASNPTSSSQSICLQNCTKTRV